MAQLVRLHGGEGLPQPEAENFQAESASTPGPGLDSLKFLFAIAINSDLERLPVWRFQTAAPQEMKKMGLCMR